MSREIALEPLTAEAFAPYGDVIETRGEPSFQINAGMCDRFHDLARVDFDGEGTRIGISAGRGRPYALPYDLTMVERHPYGSQAFLPMSEDPFMVVVAAEEAGTPGQPRAFLTNGRQGVNYLRGIWHGVLTPLGRTADFVIVDRIPTAGNLEEHHYDAPWRIVEA